MKSRSIYFAGALLAICVGVLVYQIVRITSPADATSDPNGQVAYEEAAPAPRREAAVLAVARQGRRSVTQLRKIAREDPEPTVRAAALNALGEHYDHKSMDLLLERLESPSRIERARAQSAVVRILGPRVVPQSGDKATRQRTEAKVYRRLWENLQGTKQFAQLREKRDRRYGELP
jgi:hypothetical protein